MQTVAQRMITGFTAEDGEGGTRGGHPGMGARRTGFVSKLECVSF